MADYTESIRLRLANGPMKARQLADYIKVSQPTISRALMQLGAAVVKIGTGPSIQYSLRDDARGIPEVPVYRVDSQGKIIPLGVLVPVRPAGFVMVQANDVSIHSDGLPWWLYDMRPQGYLGRAYASRYAQALGLPANLGLWNDTHTLRALLAHGHDVAGNLLLGDAARAHFISGTLPVAVPLAERNDAYVQLAREAARGEMPGSSAGGEQPKFTAYIETETGPQHVLVKFSLPDQNPVTQRWSDLLLAEHLALQTLRQANVAASVSSIIEAGPQRFLQVQRFDRVGELGRSALFSLAALDAEFTGMGAANWPAITQRLARLKVITPAAAQEAELLFAFGKLIGNSDMHSGNLSFISEPFTSQHGRPYELAPAYDMLPMAFAPGSGGQLPDTLVSPDISAEVSNMAWKQALALAHAYLQALEQQAAGFSAGFRPCVIALKSAIDEAGLRIDKLG